MESAVTDATDILCVAGAPKRGLWQQEAYHDKLGEDMERQAILERLGWVFVRIRGSVFFRDPNRAMKPVFEKLQTLEIVPSPEPPVPAPNNVPSAELTDRITRRAEQIRNEWNARESGNGTAQ